MTAVLAYTASVKITTCYKCGTAIGLANYDDLLKSHDAFFCPNGHSQCFVGKTEAEKKADRLEGELAREKQRREMAEREVKMERKRAEGAERKVKRAKNGVCTCCNRSFTNLRRHMQTQHPEAK